MTLGLARRAPRHRPDVRATQTRIELAGHVCKCGPIPSGVPEVRRQLSNPTRPGPQVHERGVQALPWHDGKPVMGDAGVPASGERPAGAVSADGSPEHQTYVEDPSKDDWDAVA
ncbi:hypothetical protein PybrP1_000224 [[Pythium] brassicae (nom. inval.)]|nr:hypothetical protein PybrP1_000224 [[Pythium] brassicae (nom. inval.)]